MLVDPVTVVAAAPTPETKFSIVKHDGYGSERVDTNGGGYSSIINHQRTKTGTRHYLQVLHKKDAVDPLSGLTRSVTASVSFTINRPVFGYTDAEMIALAKLLTDFRDDSEVTTARLLLLQA
jgi:hypothetical protein